MHCLCYLFEPVSEVESCGTYCLNLPFEFTVWIYRLILHTKAPKTITQLNTKLGFSITHIPINSNLQIFFLVYV